MRNLNHKPRRSRTFRLELLESRELLSAVGLPAHQAADVSPLARAHRETIKGSLSGQGTVNPITYSVKGPATGGSGTLAGAAGSFTAKGSLNGGVLSMNLTVTLTHI